MQPRRSRRSSITHTISASKATSPPRRLNSVCTPHKTPSLSAPPHLCISHPCLANVHNSASRLSPSSSPPASVYTGIPDLVGPIFFLLVSSVFSVLVTRFFNRVDKKTDKMKEALDTDGDGHVSAAELRAVTGGREPTRARTKNPKLRDRNGDPASSELAILPREAPNHTTCSSLSASPKRSATEVHAEVLTVGFAQQAPADMDA